MPKTPGRAQTPSIILEAKLPGCRLAHGMGTEREVVGKNNGQRGREIGIDR